MRFSTELESRNATTELSRKFKLEAVRLVKDRDVAVAQAARDLDVHENVLRKGAARRRRILGMPFPGRVR